MNHSQFITRAALANAALTAHGNLSVMSYCILLELLDRGPQHQQALCDRLHMSRPSMSHHLVRLERRGLVQRFAGPGDVDKAELDSDERRAVLGAFARGTGRWQICTPTRAGKGLVAQIERDLGRVNPVSPKARASGTALTARRAPAPASRGR